MRFRTRIIVITGDWVREARSRLVMLKNLDAYNLRMNYLQYVTSYYIMSE